MMIPSRSVMIVVACTLAGAASASDQSGRYIVVLKAVKSDQPLRDYDVRKLGGTVDNRTWDKIFVTLPPGAAETLRQHPAVRYMQAIGTSAPPAAPPSLMRLHPMPNQAPPSWNSGTYSYDGSGNIYRIGAAGVESGDGMATTYSYDLLSRLKKVDSVRSATGATGTPRTENYSYDVYGNLTLTTEGDGSQRNLTVAASSNRYQTSPDTGMAAVYDVAGRMTSYGTDVYKYDAANMMTERDHDGWSDYYVYSADDERVGVRIGDTWTWSFRDASGKVLRQYQSSASNPSAAWLWVEDYVYAGGRLLAAERPAEEGGRRHFHLDHLGTPRLITGAFGELVSQHDLTAFGAEITSPTQELTAGFDREEPMKFTGHERDFTGSFPGSNYLDYMHARFYNPTIGKFLSVDKIGGNAQRPQTWNRYAYSGNNPLKFLDPGGQYFVLANEKDRAFFAAAIAKGTRHENTRELFLQLAKDPTHRFSLSTGSIRHARNEINPGETAVFPYWGVPSLTGTSTTVDPSQYGKLAYLTPTVTIYHELWHVWDLIYNQGQILKKYGDETKLDDGTFSVFESLGYRADILTGGAGDALSEDQVSSYLGSSFLPEWSIADYLPSAGGSLEPFFDGSFSIEGIQVDWSQRGGRH